MTTVPHETVPPETPAARRRFQGLVVPEMWASVAIVAMWLAVLVTAVYGPDMRSDSAGSSTTIPSAVIVALFATIATWGVAKYGFRRHEEP